MKNDVYYECFPKNRSVEIYAEGCSYVNKMNKWL